MKGGQTCRHCGLPNPGPGEFCCSGCERVYELLRSEGLDAYYSKKATRGRRVGEADPERADFSWARHLQEQQEGEGGGHSVRLRVEGMYCPGCAWLIGKLGRRQPGCEAAEVRMSEGELHVRWGGRAFDLEAFARELMRFGYRVKPISPFEQWLRGRNGRSRFALCLLFAANNTLLESVLLLLESNPAGRLLRLMTLLFVLLSLLVGFGAGRSPTFGRTAQSKLSKRQIAVIAIAIGGSVVATVGLAPFLTVLPPLFVAFAVSQAAGRVDG